MFKRYEKDKWGRIINIASPAASVDAPTPGAYYASKEAVVGLLKCEALAGAEFCVTCNSTSPGRIEMSFRTKMILRQAIHKSF